MRTGARMKIGAENFANGRECGGIFGAIQSTATARNWRVAPLRSNWFSVCRARFSLARAAPLHSSANSAAVARNHEGNFRTACKIEMAPGESLRDAWRGCV